MALVTGASGDLGSEICRVLGAAGYALLISDLHADSLDRRAQELRDSGLRVTALAADLTDPMQAAELGARAAVAGADVLVNVAGMAIRRACLEVSAEDWSQQVAVNLQAPFTLSQHVARGLVARGAAGRIVSISSVGARGVHSERVVYDLTKAGLEAMTRNLAWELGPSGITVNCLAPGTVVRPSAPLAPEHSQHLASLTALGRMGTCSDVAGAVLFLCSPEASYITGQTLTVDGGFTLPLRDISRPPAPLSTRVRRRLRGAARQDPSGRPRRGPGSR